MLKKTVEYTDFNENPRKETFYFNLTEAEILDLELSTDGTYSGLLKRVASSESTKDLIDIFKNIIRMGYGVVSEDGRRFVKSEADFKEFSETKAYSKLYMLLATDSDEALAFVEGMMPAGMINEAKKAEFKAQAVNGFRPGFEPSRFATPNLADKNHFDASMLQGANPSSIVDQEAIMRQNQEYLDSQTRPTMPQPRPYVEPSNDESRPGFPV